MKRLSIAVALFAAVLFGLAFFNGEADLLGLAAVGVMLSVTTWRAELISRFLQIFAAIFAAEYVIFGGILTLQSHELWPLALDMLAIPESLPLTVGVFGLIVYAIAHIPGIARIMRIGDRFFDAHHPVSIRLWPFPRFRILEKNLARGFILFLVLVNQAQVAISVRISFFNRDFFNAIQDKNEAEFWYQLFFVFSVWATIYIASAVIEYVVQTFLVLRWRHRLTEYYTARWLDDAVPYRMTVSGSQADNPDQRIADDIKLFVGGLKNTFGLYDFSISLLAQASSLISFSIILWTISANFKLPGTDLAIPGFLFWIALLYSIIGTVITHLIGRPLIGLYFTRQKVEADFRFSLARLREYAEQIALLRGEAVERGFAGQRFAAILDNLRKIIARGKWLTAFVAAFSQVTPFIPYIIAAPFYFAGRVTLGVMTQTASAFDRVQGSLSYFVDYYGALADFLSVIRRLTSFDASIETAHKLGKVAPVLTEHRSHETDLRVQNVRLSLPNGTQIVEAGLAFRPLESVLITGPSGSGKSTLFRAIAGIWPYSAGDIHFPLNARLLLLPQKPYLPQGPLRDVLAYPASSDTFSDHDLTAALNSVGLGQLALSLDVVDNWAQRLSGGEQQRIAIARALLSKPDWLFLDEATSAMDEEAEAAIYQIIKNNLPKTTIVSIGHRSTLRAIHQRVIAMSPRAEGGFRLNG